MILFTTISCCCKSDLVRLIEICSTFQFNNNFYCVEEKYRRVIIKGELTQYQVELIRSTYTVQTISTVTEERYNTWLSIGYQF